MNSCTGLTSRDLKELVQQLVGWDKELGTGMTGMTGTRDSPPRKTKLWGTQHEVKRKVEKMVEAWGNVNQVLFVFAMFRDCDLV